MRLGLGLVAVILWEGLSGAAFAKSDRPKLSGVAGVEFYMSEDEMQAAVPMVRSHEADGGVVWFLGVNPIDVAGWQASLWVMLDAGIVRRIGINLPTLMENSSCRAGFDTAVAYVAAEFGPPDSSSQRGTRDSYRARFEFADRAVIEIMSGASDDKASCLGLITYYAPSIPPQ